MAKYTPCLTDTCFFTHETNNLECHHIFNGAYRKKSEKYGMKVMLSKRYHNIPPLGVHHNAKNMLILKQFGQRKFNEMYPNKNFHDVFGNKNYL